MSKSPRSRKGSQDGFTLIEMMVVLLIVAMAAAVAMPRIGRQAQRLDAAAIADELQMMLFNARIRAIARGSIETVDFDLHQGLVSDSQGRRTIKLEADLQPKLLVGRELATVDDSAKVLFFADGGSTGVKILLGVDRHGKASVIVPWLTGIPVVVRE